MGGAKIWGAGVPPAGSLWIKNMPRTHRDESNTNEEDFGRWHCRGHLPHFDVANIMQTITFRLGDSLPSTLREEWNAALKLEKDADLRARIETHLDNGCGACYLRDARIAELVENAMLHFDGKRYGLIAWVVMPNHVHAMIETRSGFPLTDVMHSWKSYTAKEANKILRRSGLFWESEYFDRYVRSQTHFGFAIRKSSSRGVV